MPPKKKLRTQLAEDDGSGRPRKWIPVDDSASARAQRVEKRWIQLADEAEAAAKLAAQQERLAAGEVVEKHGDARGGRGWRSSIQSHVGQETKG